MTLHCLVSAGETGRQGLFVLCFNDKYEVGLCVERRGGRIHIFISCILLLFDKLAVYLK